MGQYQNLEAPSGGKRITLNSLKEQFCTLNMQMLLAMQSHDGKTQEEIREKMDALQAQIDELSIGRKLSS